ncbi:MAG: signal recognition particle-docking protein FtsY [Epulopiscium sp.]|nr:signal recognition particle-docking protein FtsY [Candidatus Epulonipiscium sp.]
MKFFSKWFGKQEKTVKEFSDEVKEEILIQEQEEDKEENPVQAQEEILMEKEPVAKDESQEVLIETDQQQVEKESEEVAQDYREVKDESNEIEVTATSDLEEVIQESLEEGDITNPVVESMEQKNEKKKGFFNKLVEGLTKTRENILGGVDQVLKSFRKIDEELFEELEEALIMADIGVPTTMKIIESLREEVKIRKITEVDHLKDVLAELISDLLEDEGTGELEINNGPTIVLVIGVNGVGKTTTIGKLAHQIKGQNKKVLLAAADTFRAAAIDQLIIWGERSGVDVIHHQEGSDPGAVIYDAVQAAKSRKADVLICDTAGRLHNKKNLMEELKKIFRIISREYPDAKKEVLLVLDSTTGQNALQQAKLFQEVADLTGIILTKLDGTAKGGIVLAIKSELNIPVKYIGVGEGVDDLQPFNPKEFSKALFNQ